MEAELGRIFDFLNKTLFDGRLKPTPFSIQPNKKVSIRFSPESNSIIIGAGFAKMGTQEIPATLLHEMVHVSNFQSGVVDVTANQYHNKEFLEAALGVGLVVIKHKTQGWAITSTFYPRNVVSPNNVRKPSKEKTIARTEAFSEIRVDKVVLRAGRSDIKEKVKERKPPKTYFLKYECDCQPPHNSIRSGRRPDGPNALNIQCLQCKSKFVCVSEGEKS